MFCLPEQKGPRIDIFIQDKDGHFVSLNGVVNQLDERKEKIEKQIDNYNQRIDINKKLIKNLKQDSKRSTYTLLISIACLSALLIHNPKVQTAGFVGALTTAVVNTGAMCVLSKQRKELKQQKAWLERQEQSLA